MSVSHSREDNPLKTVLEGMARALEVGDQHKPLAVYTPAQLRAQGRKEDVKRRLNQNPRLNVTIQRDPVRDAYLAKREEERKQVLRQMLALLVMGAEQDANPPQQKKLKAHLPRLLRQFRHTGDPVPAINFIEKTMFSGYVPKNPEIAKHLENLKAAITS